MNPNPTCHKNGIAAYPLWPIHFNTVHHHLSDAHQAPTPHHTQDNIMPTSNLPMQRSSSLDATSLYKTSVGDIADRLAVMQRQESTAYRPIDYLRHTDASSSSSSCSSSDDGSSCISSDSGDSHTDATAISITDEEEIQEHIISRSKMCTWCHRLADACSLSRRSVSRSMNYLDRFLSYSSSSSSRILQDKREYQLVSMTCLYISIKVHEHVELDAALLSQISAGLYSTDEILTMESKILEVLGWRVNGPTSEEFVSLFLGTLKPEEYGYDVEILCKLLDVCTYQCELAVADYNLSVLYRPSEVGLAAVLNGLGILVDGGLFSSKNRYEYVISLLELLDEDSMGQEGRDRIRSVQVRLQQMLHPSSGASSSCSSIAEEHTSECSKNDEKVVASDPRQEVKCTSLSPSSVAIVTPTRRVDVQRTPKGCFAKCA